MANIFFIIIIIVLVVDYALERFLDYLNTLYWSNSLPDELKGIYDADKYSKSQDYDVISNIASPKIGKWISPLLGKKVSLCILLSIKRNEYNKV